MNSRMWVGAALVSWLGFACAPPLSSLRRSADEAAARGDSRTAYVRASQELARHRSPIQDPTEAFTKRRDEAATVLLLDALRAQSAVLEGPDPVAASRLVLAVSDEAKRLGLADFQQNRIVPLLEKTGLARWPEVESLRREGKMARAVALAERLTGQLPAGSRLVARRDALKAEAEAAEWAEVTRLSSDPAASWFHLQLVKHYRPPVPVDAGSGDDDDDDFWEGVGDAWDDFFDGDGPVTPEKPRPPPTEVEARENSVDEAFSELAGIAWEVNVPVPCGTFRTPFASSRKGRPASVDLRVDRCEPSHRQWARDEPRSWEEEYLVEVPGTERVCEKKKNNPTIVCSTPTKCETRWNEYDECRDVRVVRKELRTRPHVNEIVQVTYSESTLETAGAVTLRFDGNSESSPFSLTATRQAERWVGSGVGQGTSYASPSLETEVGDRLAQWVAAQELVVRRVRGAEWLRQAIEAEGTPDRADALHSLATVTSGALAEATQHWFEGRYALRADELRTLLLGAPRTEVRVDAEPFQLDLPTVPNDLPPDVVALDKIEKWRDEVGFGGLDAYAGLLTSQPRSRSGRLQNSGVVLGLRMLWLSEPESSLVNGLLLDVKLGFDLQPAFLGQLAAAWNLGFRVGGLSVAALAGLGLDGVGSANTERGFANVPWTGFLNVGARVAYRFPGLWDVGAIVSREARLSDDVPSAFFGELQVTRYLPESRDRLGLGLRHTVWEGRADVGTTELVVSYSGD